MNHSTGLQAKVAARNEVNSQVRRFAPSFLLALAPFVGKKIVNADGSFSKAFKSAMPNAGDYYGSNTYSLSRVFKASANGERSGCYYQEASVYLGEISGGVLVKLCDFNPDNFRVNYDAATIAGARMDVNAKRRALQEAERELSYFGEHDNN